MKAMVDIAKQKISDASLPGHDYHQTHLDAVKELMKEMNEGDGLWANIHKKRREGRKPRKAFSKGAPTKQDFKNASENFQDGKNPQDKGDASRHGLKGKTKAQLKKIRSSSTASKRKKQLAHWMINMHHNEEHGAGEEGTDKLIKKYKKDTPQ
jgi:hypothetical protein